jgi:hypothetical protein
MRGLKICGPSGLTSYCRSLVYVEGDATMNTYQDSEGKNRSALNIVERKFPSPLTIRPILTAPSGKLEVLKRPEDVLAS